MSNKKVDAYQTFFYYVDSNGNPLTKASNGYYKVYEQPYTNGNYFKYLPYQQIKPGLWSLIRKKGNSDERIILHDLTVEFDPYFRNKITGPINWNILRVDNKKIFGTNDRGNFTGTLISESIFNGAIKSADLQLSNYANYEWIATSKTFQNLDYNISVSDNLLLIMDITFDKEIPSQYCKKDSNNKCYAETWTNYAKFDITYTYSSSRF